MKKMNVKSILGMVLALVMSLTMIGCGQITEEKGTELAGGGVICLRVNPEIAVTYDADGNVTEVEARNDDGHKIVKEYSGYEGKACREVVAELVAAIGEAGYFVEEIEGERRQITIEIETGSLLPHDTFLDEVAEYVKASISKNNWSNPVTVSGEKVYGVTDYGVTDYLEPLMGATDYNDTDYGPNNDGVTDYIDTDYGPNNDGVTDYIDTDYGPNNDGVTDYNDTDYGPNNDGVTDYIDTDYGPNNDGVTDYNDTDYGPNNDGITDYIDTDYGPNNDGVTDFGITDYYEGTNYDAESDYDSDSRYDD